ncbi:MAG: histidine phosphatase family protein [Chloracidobacterium sp.]|nr:histidine phosphatase family protein [Chloracidobacterium sp.]
MRAVWFIRHAESLGNIGEATTTPREIPLSELGRAQADRLAETFPIRPDLIAISPFDRARFTAEPLIRRFEDVPTFSANIQEFTYLAIEKCRGTNSAQRKPLVDEYWGRSDPEYCDGGQAESFSQFLCRLDGFICDLLSREFAIAVAVTHEQVIKALMWMRIAFATEVTSASMAGFYKFMTSFKIPNIAIVPCLFDEEGQSFFGKLTRPESVNA